MSFILFIYWWAFYPLIIPGLSNPSDLLQYVLPHLLAEDSGPGKSGFVCGICFQFKHIWKANVRNHVESKHFKGQFVYKCDICGAEKTSKQEMYACKSDHNRHSKSILSWIYSFISLDEINMTTFYQSLATGIQIRVCDL